MSQEIFSIKGESFIQRTFQNLKRLPLPKMQQRLFFIKYLWSSVFFIKYLWLTIYFHIVKAFVVFLTFRKFLLLKYLTLLKPKYCWDQLELFTQVLST